MGEVVLMFRGRDPEMDAYYARAAEEQRQYETELAAARRKNESARLASLGDRLGAVIEGSGSPAGEVKLEAIGKTEQGVLEAIAAYNGRWPFNPYMTAFYAVHPWGEGFRAIGQRWDHA